MKKKKISPPESNSPAVFFVLAWFIWISWGVYGKCAKLGFEIWSVAPGLLGVLPRVLAAGLGLRIVLLAAVCFVFYSLGRPLLKLFALGENSGLEEHLLAFGLGTGAAWLVLLAAGLAGFWRPTALRWTFGVCLAASLAWALKAKAASRPINEAVSPPFGPLQYAGLLLLAFSLLTGLLATAAPEIFYDALVYHLALPKLYLLNHKIIPTPYNVFSGTPGGLQMIYGLALALGDDNLPELFHFSMGLAAFLAIWAWSRRYASRPTGLLAGMLFLLPSVVSYASWSAGVDLGAAFFCMLALFALTRSLEENETRWSILGGVFLGLAMSIKYNVFLFALALMIIHYALLRRPRATLGMLAAAGIVVSPWMLKNLLFYGDPVYPFLHQLFSAGAHPGDWKAFLVDARPRDPSEFGTIAGWLRFVTTPYDLSLGHPTVGEYIGPGFFLLLPCAALSRPGARSWRAAAWSGGLAYAAWSAGSHMVRYFLPAMPWISCALAWAVEQEIWPKWLRGAAWASALFACAFPVQAALYVGEKTGTWDFLRAGQDRASYLNCERASYGVPNYSAMDFINKSLPARAKVLFLGDARGFYCDRDFIAATVYDDNPFWTAVRGSKSPEELRSRLRKMGVTHLFVNAEGLLFYGDRATILPRAEARGEVLKEFWPRYTRRVFRDAQPCGGKAHDLQVFELLDAPRQGAGDENPFLAALRNLGPMGY